MAHPNLQMHLIFLQFCNILYLYLLGPAESYLCYDITVASWQRELCNVLEQNEMTRSYWAGMGHLSELCQYRDICRVIIYMDILPDVLMF